MLIDETPVAANGSVRLDEEEAPPDESAGHEEREPNPPTETTSQATRLGCIPGWAATRGWVATNRLSTGLAVALVVAVVVLILSQLSLSSKDSLAGARTSALAAAKSYSVDLASYNYEHLGRDFDKVDSESTPSFRQSYNQSSDALKPVLTRYEASAQATVVAAGLVSASTNRVVALVFLNQTVNNTAQKGKPASDESRIEITLLRSGGRWLINQVTLL